MTPRPYLQRAYSQVPAQPHAAAMAAYTGQGGFVCCRKRAATTTPMMAEIVWMNSSMAGE